MFMAEKGITGIALVPVDLNAQEHKAQAFRVKARWPPFPHWSWTMAAS
jgi:hypothetical protein